LAFCTADDKAAKLSNECIASIKHLCHGVNVTVQDFSSMRAAMVASQLRTNEVSNPRIADAFLAVERERFVPVGRSSVAYTDLPISLGNGRSLNAPLATARLINEVMPAKGESILLIGAATGYAASILGHLGCVVTAVEQDQALVDVAKPLLASQTDVTIVTGPLPEGCVSNAPYDVIIVDGAIESLPQSIVNQCADGGRVAAGIVDAGVVRLSSGYKAAGAVVLIPFAECQSVILPGFAPAKVFVF
jgi:protein-L-isoaspartate(D-aspartate) O-methyltransferase